MAKDNLTAILYGINDIRLEQTPIEEPEDGEVLLEIKCVGICGSDVHYLVRGEIGDFVVRKPMIMGHEASGVVVKLGKNVMNLKVGDRVAIEPGVPCRICDFCKNGRYNLCKDIVFCATPPYHGNLKRFYKHAADFCFKLPDNVSFEEGALMEPLSVGVHACKRANVGMSSKVLILGAGPIGLVIMMVVKSIGATKVVITDLVQKRLDVAKQLGADETLLIKTNETTAETISKIHALFGEQPDKVIDASGAETSIQMGILAVKNGGTVVLVGLGSPNVKIPVFDSITREIDIKGSFRYGNDYDDAMKLVASGKVNVKPLVTHNYKLEETVEAFENAKSGQGGAVKIMIHCT